MHMYIYKTFFNKHIYILYIIYIYTYVYAWTGWKAGIPTKQLIQGTWTKGFESELQ